MSDRIFEIRTLKSIIIKSCFEIIKPYIRETNVIINQEGIKISTIDTSKSTITYLKLDANKFEIFKCESPVVIGIDVETIYKALKTTNRTETFTLYMEKNDSDKLCIELYDHSASKIRSYKIPLLMLNDKIINIQDMTYDSIISIPSSHFQKVIKEMHLLDSKIIEIKSIGKQLIFQSDDGGAEFQTIINENDSNISSENDCENSTKFEKVSDVFVQGKFKLVFFMNIIKASHLCDHMNIFIGNDKPLILQYFVADLGVMSFLIMQTIV